MSLFSNTGGRLDNDDVENIMRSKWQGWYGFQLADEICFEIWQGN